MPLLATELRKELDSLGFAFRRKLQGLLLFRLFVAVFFLVLTILVQSRRNGDLLADHLQPLYFFSAILFVFTIVASLSLGNVRRLKAFAYVQILFDVVAVTVLIFLSGGVDSIYSFLYMPVIISSAILLLRKGSLLTASICSLCYGMLLDLQFFGWIRPLEMVKSTVYSIDSSGYFHILLMNIVAFFLVAYISGSLAEQLEKTSYRIQQQQKDLNRLEMLNQNIVQSINSGLLTVDLHGHVKHYNRHAQEILGLSHNQIMHCHIQEIFPEQENGFSLPDLPDSGLLQPHALTRKEIRYSQPSGNKLYLGYTISALQDLSRQYFGWIINFQDLTVLKEMETHMQRTERLALAGKIAAEIAHEIKNPLAAMSGSMQMLEHEVQKDPCLAKLTGIVCREIDRINGLVTDLLWLARRPANSERIQPVPVCSAIMDTISLMRDQHEMSSRYQVHTVFSVDPIVNLDPHLFQQVLWNLLKNALEAMPSGGELQVRVGYNGCENGQDVSQDRQVVIDIQDSGSGIPPELQEKIFEPFFTTKERGTGLGLSTVYQLVQSSGGRIEFQSELNRGSTFSVIFPGN